MTGLYRTGHAKIIRAGMRSFALPLVSPLATAHGPIAERDGFLISLQDEAGRIGHGEATPLPDFGTEDRETCARELRMTLERLVQDRQIDLDSILGSPCSRSGLEAALADLAAQNEGATLSSWIRKRAGLAGEPCATLRVQALLSGEAPGEVAESARAALAAGFDVFKLKLAVSPERRDLARDVERVSALRSVVGPDRRVRLDANEAWSLREAEGALKELAVFGIDFVEQPVARAAVDELAVLAREGPIDVAADEALLKGGASRCLASRAASIFIVKPAALGGLGPSIELAERARAEGIRIVWSNLIEGAVGRAGALAIAAGLSDAEETHGLGTAALLAKDFASAGGSVLEVDEALRCVRSLAPAWAQVGDLWGAGVDFESGA